MGKLSNEHQQATVHVVHCVDTEGPLYESLERTFGRINQVFGLTLEPSKKLLRQLQTQMIDLGGLEESVARMVDPVLLDLNHSWEKLEDNHKELFSACFRAQHSDSFGRPWIMNWFCCDHVGYSSNPSNREIGVHKIFEYYENMVEQHPVEDTLELHFHPSPHTYSSISNAVHWFSTSTKLFEILAARIIDKNWFPSCHRPGFHTIRPESHWFLEQFIPFDFANQAVHQSDEQPDVAGGRFGDWRRAPKLWRPYHPAHDDHQIAGNCRRSIFRCLNVGTRFRCLTQRDVNDAFSEAMETGQSVLAFTDHDFRDQRPNIRSTYEMLKQAQRLFPDVTWKNNTARNSAQSVLELREMQDFELGTSLVGNRLSIHCEMPSFGPQPFLAIKAKDGRYIHDAFDIHEPFHRWSYTFDEHSLPLDQVDSIGIASNSQCGQTAVVVIRI